MLKLLELSALEVPEDAEPPEEKGPKSAPPSTQLTALGRALASLPVDAACPTPATRLLRRTCGVEQMHTRFPKKPWEIMKIHGF